MLWVKAFHIIFLVTWFAGLFYLPRLFMYHALADDSPSRERFVVMERKLFIIMSIGALGTICFGLWLLLAYAWSAYANAGWLHAKMGLAALLIGYHFYCFRLMKVFERNENQHGAVFYRWLNEIPAIVLVGMVILAIVKPF